MKPMARYAEFVGARLGVCSWSLQPQSAADLARLLSQDLKMRRLQLALDPLRERLPGWDQAQEILAASQVELSAGMFGTIGEDYSSLDSIRRTGGVVPDETWDANWRNIQANAVLAGELQLKLVTFHAGFLPHDDRDPDYQKLLGRMERIATLFASRGIHLGLETGQETADTLARFLDRLDCPTVGVNFDPANMILYDKGDPISALRTLGKWLKQCHIKDAKRTCTPGAWGEEVVVGAGEVDWPAFMQTLVACNYAGRLMFEREAGNQRVQDICAGHRFISSL